MISVGWCQKSISVINSNLQSNTTTDKGLVALCCTQRGLQNSCTSAAKCERQGFAWNGFVSQYILACGSLPVTQVQHMLTVTTTSHVLKRSHSYLLCRCGRCITVSARFLQHCNACIHLCQLQSTAHCSLKLTAIHQLAKCHDMLRNQTKAVCTMTDRGYADGAGRLSVNQIGEPPLSIVSM